jgi:hypothetical protein
VKTAREAPGTSDSPRDMARGTNTKTDDKLIGTETKFYQVSGTTVTYAKKLNSRIQLRIIHCVNCSAPTNEIQTTIICVCCFVRLRHSD